jgi:hypothetical protein
VLEEGKLKTKKIVLAVLSFLMLSGVFFASANAAPSTWPSLPTNFVTLNVAPGAASYFLSTLSGVGPGYDVMDGVYHGWCIDQYTTMSGSDHLVKLYSSLSNKLPAAVSSVPWNKINYILNHKQGSLERGMDVQDAIWYFTDGIFPSSSVAQAMIAEANANQNFVPGIGQMLAVILLRSPEDTSTQHTIIEIIRTSAPGNGKVTGGGQCIVGPNTEIPSASFGFNAMWFSRDPTPKGELNYIDHITGQHVHVHDLTYLEVWDDAPGNKPWPMLKAKFGGQDVYSGKMVDVYVEDHGEPGKDDKFLIYLGGEYLGGSGNYFGESSYTSDPILAGNIQIHKPPK